MSKFRSALCRVWPAAMLCAGVVPAFAQSGAATSSVTVYGLVDAATRRVNNADANRGSLLAMGDGIITGTRLGFRGREDLGGGMAAHFTLEAGFDPSSGLSLQGTPTADFGQVQAPVRFFGREAHVSLRNNFGGITLGRNYTVAHTMASRLQPLGNPNSASHSLFSSHHVARQDNNLRLDARIGDTEWMASYTFGEQAATRANCSWAVGAGYAAGALSLAAYAQQMKNLAGTETRKIVGLGGNYRFAPAFHLFGGWMRRADAVSPQRNRAWTLGANLVVGPLVTLSLAHFDDRQSGSAALAGSRRLSWAVLSYNFSRRTDVYAVLDNNSVEGGYAKPAFMGTKGSQRGFGFGLRHRF